MTARDTKGRLLEVATSLFAADGFDGTSVSSIVGAAEVNKRMLYHYYDSKEGLYRAVFAEQWLAFAQGLVVKIQPLLAGDDTPERSRAILLGAVGAYYDYMAENPHFVRLIAWEGLEGGAISRSLWGDVSGPVFQQVTALIESTQRHGVLDPELHPGHFVISMMGIVTYYFTYGRSLGDLIDGPVFTPEAIAARRVQLLKTVSLMLFAK